MPSDIITRFVSVVSEGCSTAGPPRLLAQELMITNITKAEKKLEKNTLLQFFLDILLPNSYYEYDKHKISWYNVIQFSEEVRSNFWLLQESTDLIRKWVGRNLGFQS